MAKGERGALESPIDWNYQIGVWIDIDTETCIWTDSVLGVKGCEKNKNKKKVMLCVHPPFRVWQGFRKGQYKTPTQTWG